MGVRGRLFPRRAPSPARLCAALLLAAAAVWLLRQHLSSSGSGALTGAGTAAQLDVCLLGKGQEARRSKLFLYIGIISARNNYKRRQAVRDAWGDASQVPGVSMTRFFVPSRGVTHQWTVKEMASHNDFVFLDMSATYQTIGSQVIALYEHVVDEHDVAFVLKTDDDSFVNVPAMLADLRARCSSADCTVVKLYMGFQVDDTVVTWQRPDHPHNSAEFAAHTGLTHYYPKYMVGGGYIVSGDVAKMIVVTNKLVGLKLYTLEDATFGYWLQPWDVRHVNHTRFRTIADFCCFGMPTNNATGGAVSLDIFPHIERDLCSADPWLILHKVGEAQQMRLLGERVRNCTAPVPAS